jgi:hypothetical protein
VKSHHQKLEDKYQHISKIISYLEKGLRTTPADTLSDNTDDTDDTDEASSHPPSKDAHVQTDFFTLDELFFEIDYPENHVGLTFITEDESLFI